MNKAQAFVVGNMGGGLLVERLAIDILESSSSVKGISTKGGDIRVRCRSL